MKKNKTTSWFFEFVLELMFFLAAGGVGVSIIKSQIGFAIVLFLIMFGVAISILQLLTLQAKIEALQKMNDLLRKDNTEKWRLLKNLKSLENKL